MKYMRRVLEHLKEDITEALQLPKDVALNWGKVTLVGRRNAIVENFLDILEYENGYIKLKTKEGLMSLTGVNLSVVEITEEHIILDGVIERVEFL